MKDYLAKIEEVIASGPYKATWESLGNYPVPQWYSDAKFGIFIHWGVYAVPAFGNEWYPRHMYVKGTPEYAHHVKTYGEHKNFGYKDFIPMFKAESFDPKAWMRLFRDAGAKYVMPVAEHHDGFKMYKSGLSKWNSAEMGPCRDIIGALKAEADLLGIRLCCSNHRAEHFWFFSGGLEYESDVSGAGYDDFYGPPHKGIDDHQNLTDCPPTQEHLTDWLLTNCEMVDKYRPAVVYFDWWIQQMQFKPYLRKFAAYYYNRAAEWGEQVAINNKFDSYLYTSTVFDIERGQLSGVPPRLWQTDTSIAKNSWGYTENNDFKKASGIAADLADIISKNGCLLLNVGPKPDGTITEEETRVLLDMGAWLKTNGEAVYGSAPWRIFGEGPTEIPDGEFSDTIRQPFTSLDIRFTTNRGNLYAFVLKSPEDGAVTIRSLGLCARNLLTVIKKISVLGSDSYVNFTQGSDALKVNIHTPVKTDFPICLKIEMH
ncbi:MAG: alpha-L-fucosidase [Oscillospiraceae bacterium]|nr:alpha-L-fucosidase [Oscillospiraceae bacterium]